MTKPKKQLVLATILALFAMMAWLAPAQAQISNGDGLAKGFQMGIQTLNTIGDRNQSHNTSDIDENAGENEHHGNGTNHNHHNNGNHYGWYNSNGNHYGLPNNPNYDGNEQNNPGNTVTPAALQITGIRVVGDTASTVSGATLLVDGTVTNPPPQYAILMQIGVPGHGSLMQMDDFSYDSSTVVSAAAFTMQYVLEPGQNQYAAEIVTTDDVKGVVLIPNTDTSLKLLAIARSDYQTPDGSAMIAYNIIARGSAPYLIRTLHGVDSSGIARVGVSMEAMDNGNTAGSKYLLNPYAMDKIEFYKAGTLFKTYSSYDINAVTNRLPSAR